MAELGREAKTSEYTQTSPDATLKDFCLGSAVYIRYKDHVIFKNLLQPLTEAVERETMGWLTKQNEEVILLEQDRATQIPSSKRNGIVILKNCIQEIQQLPELGLNLNCQRSKQTTEYALQTKKRKTLNV
jgi:hypothetical protein